MGNNLLKIHRLKILFYDLYGYIIMTYNINIMLKLNFNIQRHIPR